MLKAIKFGGSSVAGAEQFARVKAIVESDPARRLVVVSAAGKRSGTITSSRICSISATPI